MKARAWKPGASRHEESLVNLLRCRLAWAAQTALWIRNLASFDLALTPIVLLLTGIAAYYVPSGSHPPAALMVAAQIAITAIFMWKLSAGLGLYWVASSGVSVIQNVVLRWEQKRVQQAAGSGKPL